MGEKYTCTQFCPCVFVLCHRGPSFSFSREIAAAASPWGICISPTQPLQPTSLLRISGLCAVARLSSFFLLLLYELISNEYLEFFGSREELLAQYSIACPYYVVGTREAKGESNFELSAEFSQGGRGNFDPLCIGGASNINTSLQKMMMCLRSMGRNCVANAARNAVSQGNTR